MRKKELPKGISIPAIKLRQWLTGWDGFRYDPKQQQAKPPAEFFLCSMKASHLKALTGVYRRSTKGGSPRSLDQNVQRGHEEKRSEQIREFVQHGFPWCEMTDSNRKDEEAEDLKKPGWLPTAILVNILPAKSTRNGLKIDEADLVRIEEENSHCALRLPDTFKGLEWEPKEKSVYPLEVIDGQHRLWAFEHFDPAGDFDLPVVAFYGLDHGWQAYLFWSVNITPKKINRSLAFDLYPLLRQQTWLDRFKGHSIYRETRCQELVEALWTHNESPWHMRINMLGEKREDREYKGQTVTQAAWVRSLMASFVKQWEGHGKKGIGGLFGAPRSKHELSLPWNRAMQGAFLIYAARSLKCEIGETEQPWAKYLRKIGGPELFAKDDPAFYGEYSLLTTDQGIRGFLFVVNDLCWVAAPNLELTSWRWDQVYDDPKAEKLAAVEETAVSAAIATLSKTKVADFLRHIARGLAKYDWRTSSTPGITEPEKVAKLVFRGSSGYKELRRQLIGWLSKEKGLVGDAAKKTADCLGHQ